MIRLRRDIKCGPMFLHTAFLRRLFVDGPVMRLRALMRGSATGVPPSSMTWGLKRTGTAWGFEPQRRNRAQALVPQAAFDPGLTLQQIRCVGMFTRFLAFTAALLRNQWRSLVELRRIQQRKLRRILHHAYENVPFYRHRFRSANLTPGDFRTVEDLRRLPLPTKRELSRHPLRERTSRAVALRKSYIGRTSCSTGEPLTYAVGDESHDFITACHLRRHLALGFWPWDKMVFLLSSRRSVVTGNIVSEPARWRFLGELGKLLPSRLRSLSIYLSLCRRSCDF